MVADLSVISFWSTVLVAVASFPRPWGCRLWFDSHAGVLMRGPLRKARCPAGRLGCVSSGPVWPGIGRPDGSVRVSAGGWVDVTLEGWAHPIERQTPLRRSTCTAAEARFAERTDWLGPDPAMF